MKVLAFLSHYLRSYWRWAILALGATVLYAAATVVLIQLLEPVFSEVLQIRSADMPGGLGGLLPGKAAAVVPATATGPSSVTSADPASLPAASKTSTGSAGVVKEAQQARVFLDRFLHDGYERIKAAFHVAPDQVIYFVPLLFVAVFILRSFSDFLNGYAFQHLGLGATTDLRNDLYARTLAQSSRFHADHPSGELVSRVVNDIGVLQAAVSTRLVDLVQQSVTLIGLLCLLFSIQFKLALFCVVVAPLVLYPIVRFSKGMRKTSHRTQERTADLANLVSESCRGHRVVKAFGMEAFEESRFREATRRHLRANLRGQMLSNLSGPVIESLGVLGAGVFLVFAGRAIHSQTMEPGVLVKFLIGLYAMYDPIRKLNKVNLVVQQSMAAAQRIRGLMVLPVEIQDRPGAVAASDLKREIHFENVSFRYEEKEVLSGVEFTVRRGEAVALVGPSGGGKTTLCNLVPRFFDVTGGRILIDGVDVRDLRLETLRGMIGLVTQETILFNDSVRANIAYGRKDLPLDAVREAARAAFADEFILELPEGYDTVVGEGGVRLSGGQRQRLAIARALLKNAPILILDEATSMLDTESESLVQKALGNLMRDRTTFVIAHRLTTITMVDRIFVVEAGRIVEQGSHAELLAADGLYRRLYDLQFRD
ncbi:MAG: ABC transporter ATP-binding protein [Thermoanaerobaculia bacterium]